MLRLGAFDIPKVPGVFGAPISHIEKMLALDIDGVVGAGLLSNFRITFGDGGRLMWIEDDTALLRMLKPAGSSGGPNVPDAPSAVPVPGATPAQPLVSPPVLPAPSPPPKAPAPSPKDKKPGGDPRPPKTTPSR
jgi:hypothetical protein